MKPILKFPKIIILSLITFSIATEVQVPFSPDYEYYDHDHPEAESSWPEDVLTNSRTSRAMYLAQGVEFVFPIGVQYTLANVNEQLWPVGTEGFDSVLEFPKSKIAVMFSSMVNTLKIANFTVSSTIYTPEHASKQSTTPLRILGTDIKDADFRQGYKDSWNRINKDVSQATGGAIPEFIPRGGLYGRTIYPFTAATYVNSIHYHNHWAFPWNDSPADKFTDSEKVPYLEVEGLMPFYENDAFVAVAALFKSGTGSVVFLKPKGTITILQLMLNPTALTQIFDENFPGWGVKQMKVRIPKATFTTNSQHFDMLVKRGVTNSFCLQEPDSSRYSLNPIVQTNNVQILKDSFSISSVTGVTLNNEKDLNGWNARSRTNDMAPETLLEEYTTPMEGLLDDAEADIETSTELPTTVTEIILEDAAVDEEASASTTVTSQFDEALEGRDLDAAASASTKTESDPETAAKQKKAADTMDFYDFNEPFLWFLHAINEEPMFMGVIESFKRYLEETGHKENLVKGEGHPSISSGLVEKNKWIFEAAKGVLWHCPSLINKQAE